MSSTSGSSSRVRAAFREVLQSRSEAETEALFAAFASVADSSKHRDSIRHRKRRKRAMHGMLGVIDRGTPKRHDSIADKFVDVAVMRFNGLNNAAQIPVG